jgi:hypothetical protein
MEKDENASIKNRRDFIEKGIQVVISASFTGLTFFV